MISGILNDLAAGSTGFAAGSTAVDGATDFFGGLLAQFANAVGTVFGS